MEISDMKSRSSSGKRSPWFKWLVLQAWIRFFDYPRYSKQAVLLGLDLLLIPLCVALAIVARWGDASYQFTTPDLVTIILTMIFSAACFLRIGLYRAIIRFMGQQAIITIVQGVTISALILAVAAFLTRSGMPRSTPLIYWGFALVAIGGVRLVIRVFYQGVILATGDKVAIYGAGASGRQLLNTIQQAGEYSAAVFVDDNKGLIGRVVNGVAVHHPDDLPALIQSLDLNHVFLALPSATHKRRREIIDELEGLPVHVKTVPDFADLMSGIAQVGQLQDIELEDLLGRDPVPPNPDLIDRCIAGKVVMVTGAGGSIGSELCRQIVPLEPDTLILLDNSEFSLYQISKDLDQMKAAGEHSSRVVPLLGSVQNQKRLESICSGFGVNTIYHAAAYKHVPLVEFNIVEGVLNNVFGTLSAAKAAVGTGVENFVLISTDKAVRPTNVMGASKRMAELVLQACAQKYDVTGFSMVRFGNVLGSSGSVVPLFREQIKLGGPVTVTHPEVVRYFMTIPEAAQLVLQASAMGGRGEVFVLDMGEPVRIEDLARRLIRLMGFEVKDKQHPKGDIKLQYTGLRPGEKLCEELLVGNNVTGTEHPKILRADEELLSEADIDQLIAELKRACENNDCEEIQSVLARAVSGFEAKDGISDAMWQHRKAGQYPVKGNIVAGAFAQKKD